MAKPDIRSESMLKWDEYKDKSFDLALPSIYGRADIDGKRYASWYWTSIETKRNTSLGVRFLTFILLIFGTLLPVAAGLLEKPDAKLTLTQLGVCALALGGLLQVGDRIFGWSSGWIRYISTATAMENLLRKFEMEWAGYVIDKLGKLSDSDTKPLFDKAVQLQEGLIKLQIDETESWKAEFNTGGALLGDLIKSQRESADKAQEAARATQASQKTTDEAAEKAKQTGAVEVTFVHKSTPVEVGIAVDDSLAEKFTGLVWSKLKIPPGQHKVVITPSGSTSPLIAKVVDIKPAMTTPLEVKLI